MDSPRQMWLKRVNQISFGLIMTITLGKFLTALLIGVVVARSLAPWAYWIIGLGIVLEVFGKWRWLKGFPIGSPRKIWLAHRGNLGYGLVSLVIGAKMLVGLGLGVLFSELLAPYLNNMLITLIVLGSFGGIKFFQIKT